MLNYLSIDILADRKLLLYYRLFIVCVIAAVLVTIAVLGKLEKLEMLVTESSYDSYNGC